MGGPFGEPRIHSKASKMLINPLKPTGTVQIDVRRQNRIVCTGRMRVSAFDQMIYV